MLQILFMLEVGYTEEEVREFMGLPLEIDDNELRVKKGMHTIVFADEDKNVVFDTGKYINMSEVIEIVDFIKRNDLNISDSLRSFIYD